MISRTAILTAWWLLAFFCYRITLWGLFPQHFHTLKVEDFIAAAGYGLRFDGKILAPTLGILLLLRFFPCPLTQSSNIRRAMRHLSAATIAGAWLVTLVLLVADLRFFAASGYHVGVEIRSLFSEFGLFIEIFWSQWMIFFPTTLIAVLSAAWCWKIVATPVTPIPTFRMHLLCWGLLLAVVAMVARGSLGYRPLSLAHAYQFGKIQGEISLNPLFTMVYSALETDSSAWLKSSDTEIYNNSIRWLGQPPEKAFLRAYPKYFYDQPNIVLIVMESLSYGYIDSLSGASWGVTPVLDALTKKALVFEHFYASGTRSLDSLQAILFGVPVLPGLPSVLSGIERTGVIGIGTLAKQAGYATFLAQSYHRHSFNLDAYAARAGFDHYAAQQDIAIQLPYPDDKIPYGGYDFEQLQTLCSTLTDAPSPFFATMFTGSTHEPLHPKLPQFERYSNDHPRGAFLNALYYSDWALGEFFTCAQEEGWFADSIFLITADHTAATERDYRIPLLIYAPHRIKPAQRTEVYDNAALYPTLLHLMGYTDTFRAFSTSLLDPQAFDFPFILWHRRGSLAEAITAQGIVTLDSQGQWLEVTTDSLLNQRIQAEYLTLRWLFTRNLY